MNHDSSLLFFPVAGKSGFGAISLGPYISAPRPPIATPFTGGVKDSLPHNPCKKDETVKLEFVMEKSVVTSQKLNIFTYFT